MSESVEALASMELRFWQEQSPYPPRALFEDSSCRRSREGRGGGRRWLQLPPRSFLSSVILDESLNYSELQGPLI